MSTSGNQSGDSLNRLRADEGSLPDYSSEEFLKAGDEADADDDGEPIWPADDKAQTPNPDPGE
jgi:hypothetical protein